MTISLNARQPECEPRIRSATALWLGLDFDGTLVDLQDDPFAVTMPAPVRDTIETLANRFPTAIISGRSLTDLRSRARIPEVTLAGNHGLEWEMADEIHRDPIAAAARPAMEALIEQVSPWLAGFEGAFLEDKLLTIEIHFRRVPHCSEIISAKVEDCVSRHASLSCRRDAFGIQILPQGAGSKGTAAKRLAQANALPIYLGDSRTDEDAFAALNHGITICVGKHPTRARYRLDSPMEVLQFLHWLNLTR